MLEEFMFVALCVTLASCRDPFLSLIPINTTGRYFGNKEPTRV